MRRAIEFNLDRSGAHGLPSGLYADWNDCLRFGPQGRVDFRRPAVAVRLGRSTCEVCRLLSRPDEEAWADRGWTSGRRLAKYAWDGQWYLRGYGADGDKYGSDENAEGEIYLNPQSWAVISGHADAARPRRSGGRATAWPPSRA